MTKQDDRQDFKIADRRNGLPLEIPAGRILAHNHVDHTIDMPSGVNGFRFWTWPIGGQPEHFMRCPCGWSALPHYAAREFVTMTGGKCISAEQFNRDNSGRYTIEEAIAQAADDEEHDRKG
jgi:hypothetical protein